MSWSDQVLRAATIFVWMLVAAVLIVLAALVLDGCGAAWGPPRPSVDGEVDQDPGACEAACERLRALGCPAGDGSPGRDEVPGTEDDEGCEVVCRNVVGAYDGSTLHQGCTAAAESCEAVERCFEEGG